MRPPEPPADVWVDDRVEVGRSSIHGSGLFAAARIAEGTVVLRLGGTLVTTDELAARIDTATRRGAYVDSITVFEDSHLVLPEATTAHYGNHSCDPTLWPTGPYELAARRDIVPGEELTLDYGASSGAPGFTMSCRCGAPMCRGRVTSEDWRLTDLQHRYRGHWVPALEARIEHGPVTIRRVGFRAGTDGELRMLHAVEAVVDAERRPDRAPQPLASYVAFARTLPSQFDDHGWVALAADDTPVGAGFCWSNASGDQRVMECDVMVVRDHRRRRIGSRLLATICDATLDEGRTLLLWSTFDAVPAGEVFARGVGARVARVNRTSELRLDRVDWPMIERWIAGAAGRGLGYTLDVIVGPYPAARRGDGARFHHIMQTQPRDDLDAGDVVLTEQDIEELDAAMVESGRERWTVLVRDPNGACVGGTEVTFEPWEPATALQQNTGIDPAHRGLGLAKWCKAAMLERLLAEHTAVDRIRTGNAFSNAPMLAINDALGFEVISTRTEWQAEAATVWRALVSG